MLFCNFVSIVGFYKDSFKSLVSKHAKLQHTIILTIQHVLLKVPLHALHDFTHYYVHAGLQAKEGLYNSRGPNVLHRQKHVESHL